ncbi:hypothetical protein KQX54_000303, partial [Cotesia glomerata]
MSVLYREASGTLYSNKVSGLNFPLISQVFFDSVHFYKLLFVKDGAIRKMRIVECQRRWSWTNV